VLTAVATSAGTMTATATVGSAFRVVGGAAKKVTYGTAMATASGPGPVKLDILPTAKGRKALNKKKSLQVAVRVNFHPVGGTPTTSDKTVTVKKGKKGKKGK
jgi:hypothetical protein